MADYLIVWVDYAQEQYLSFDQDVATRLSERLRALAADPKHHARYDPSTDRWSAHRFRRPDGLRNRSHGLFGDGDEAGHEATDTAVRMNTPTTNGWRPNRQSDPDGSPDKLCNHGASGI